jgi:hypothetical protein
MKPGSIAGRHYNRIWIGELYAKQETKKKEYFSSIIDIFIHLLYKTSSE